MKRLILSFIIAISLPAIVNAQAFPLPIHGNPQKAFYNNGTEFKTLSCQEHWPLPTIDPITGSTMLSSHIHIDGAVPDGAEQGKVSIDIPIILTTFNLSGSGTIRLDENDGLNIRYDTSQAWRDRWGAAVANWALPTVDAGSAFVGGDGNTYIPGAPGLVTVITGTATLDPTNFPAHGWYPIGLTAHAYFANGDNVSATLRWSEFLVTDLSLPEVPPGDGEGRPYHQCIGGAFSPRNNDNLHFGEHFVEVDQILPLFGPVSSDHPWSFHVRGYSYASTGITNGVTSVRADLDLHHDILGMLLSEARTPDAPNGVTIAYTLPGALLDGPHKIGHLWASSDAFGLGETLTSNLVFTVTTGPGGVAQPDENLPPIITPPPIETQTWQNVTPEFQQLLDSVTGFLAQFKICANGICQVLH